MNRDDLHIKLREEALANAGRVSLSELVTCFVPVAKLRDLVREHGLSPKGGYRLEKAPAKVLAPLLVEPESPDVLSEVCKVLAAHMTEDLAEEKATRTTATVDLQPILKLKEQDLAQARAELDKAREVTQGLRERLAELSRKIATDSDRITRQAKEVADLRDEIVRQESAQPVARRDQSSRIQALEKELEEESQIELQQRMRLAEHAARLRDREDRIAELEELVPVGKRRKKKKMPPPPPHFVVPRFTSSFIKSLDGKDRRSIEQAYRAVFLFCCEGPRYPGLQVKALETMNLWSLRASLRLRVYFRRRGDGDVEILELLDREEQETLLRRYKERQG